MNIIDRLDNFSINAIRYIDEHSKWFYGIGSIGIYLAIVIPATITSGVNFMFTLAMLFAACIIGWPMMLIYIPFWSYSVVLFLRQESKSSTVNNVKIII